MTITEIWCGVLALIGWAGTHTAHTSQTHSLTKYSSKYIKMFYTCKLLVNQACVSEVKFRDNAFIETRNHWSAMLTFILQSLSLLPWWGWQNECWATVSCKISTSGLHKARVFGRAAIKKPVVSKASAQKYTLNAAQNLDPWNGEVKIPWSDELSFTGLLV